MVQQFQSYVQRRVLEDKAPFYILNYKYAGTY